MGCGWFLTTRLCGKAATGEVDVFNIIICTQKYIQQNKYSPFVPQNAVAASSNNSKVGSKERMAVHAAKAWNSKEVAQKSWFPVSVGFGLRRSKP
jgi:hypothetical protein